VSRRRSLPGGCDGRRHWTDDQAIDAWLEWLAGSRGRKPRTIEAYGSRDPRLHEYLKEFGTRCRRRRSQLETFTGLWLHKKGVIARSRIPYVSAVKGFYKFAAARGICRRNAAKELEHPKTGKPLPRVISLANAEKLMWAPDMGTFIGIRDAAMLSLLVGCGPRISGLVALNESDLRATQIGNEARLTVTFTEKGERHALDGRAEGSADAAARVPGHEELKAIDRNIEPRPGQRDRVLFVSVRSDEAAAARARG
jgi:integrase/recombinase XerD